MFEKAAYLLLMGTVYLLIVLWLINSVLRAVGEILLYVNIIDPRLATTSSDKLKMPYSSFAWLFV